MKINILFALVLIISAFFISGCQKLDRLDNLDASGVDAEYAIPLFSTGFAMEEVLNNFDENSSVPPPHYRLLHLMVLPWITQF